ncbi:MFS transporter [Solitalea sp. MAHUQ-68]|uniref:MFS transporter n=1 Tax=Solitalea agri TaxID=2953739 RepID=A0A9X2F0S7_9SPHI|nr:MFS transporter [Solitalea agri]MCO4292592.1 MFS transporter [Solitalea agri]
MNTPKHTFSRYQIFVIAILAILQFTIILDFMVLSPLGPFLMKELNMHASQFGLVVSAYAFSAGISGLLAAGFADKFDRKRLLMFFYMGFILGTALCAMAPNFGFLLFARIVTGIFGGVIGSISFAIITDLFKMEVRGRVMGFVQMAFAASQVLGLPIGLVLANHFGWHAPFWMIAGFGVVLGMVMLVYLQPVNEHLKLKRSEHNAFKHLSQTISQPNYLKAFLGTTLLATGGFMLMPFGSAFSTHNMGVPIEKLSLLYFVTGIFSMILGPLSGKISDKIGKYKMFVIGSIISIIMVAIYTNLGVTPLWTVIGLNILLFAGISSRMISASALMTAVPKAQDRGAFMSINSAIQQISGGIAATVAGLIVVEAKDGKLENYNVLGYVVIIAMVIAIGMMYFINKLVMDQLHAKPAEKPTEEPVEIIAEV